MEVIGSNPIAPTTEFCLACPPKLLRRQEQYFGGFGQRLLRTIETMARPKKTSPKRRRQQGSTRPAVVWIAPNLERITKGEQGRRGLNDPTSGYYLSLADLVLKGGAATKISQPVSSTLSGDEALFSKPYPAGSPGFESATRRQVEPARKPPRISSKQLKSPPISKRPKVEIPRQSSPEHPKLALPRLQGPKPPTVEHPKPPKNPRKPKPPRQRS